MDKKQAFGQFLYRNRMDRKLTQAALAEAVGTPRAYISQIEGGKRLPNDDLMRRLLIAVGASLEDFTRQFLALTDAPPEQIEAAAVIMRGVDSMQAVIGPEAMQQLIDATPSIEQIGASLAAFGDVPLPPGPEGWLDLSVEDRRLVQRLINRLRKEAKK